MTTIANDLDAELDEMAERELRAPTVTALAPVASDEDRNFAVMTHIATIAAAVFTGGFLDIAVPAVAYVLFRDRSAFLKAHVRDQLNYQLTSLLVSVAAIVLGSVTFGIGLVVAVPVLIAFFVLDVVCSIRAAMAASRGERYNFPFSLELLK